MHQKNVIFVITGTLNILILSMNYIFAMVVMQTAMGINDVAIVYVKGSATEFIFGMWAKMMQLA